MPTEINKTNSILFKILAICWAFFIIPDYFFNHAYFEKSISNFGYTGYILFSIVIFGGFLFWKSGKKDNILKSFSLSISGWQVVLGSSLSALVLYIFFHNNILKEGNAISEGIRMLGVGLLYSLGFMWIIVSAFAMGIYPLQKIKNSLHKVSHQIISIALGLGILGTIAAIIGQFGLLYNWVLWMLTTIPTLVFHKEVLTFLKSIMVESVTFKQLNLLKVSTLFLMLIFIAAGFISTLKPFPIGFDGSGLYMNTTSLITNYHALPEGGQAFNWSLIMAFGEIMFGQTTISIMLSHFMVFLIVAVIYRLARLAMSPSRAWIPMMIFLALPSVVYQTVREEKTDFGLTFIILAAFLLLLEIKKNKGEKAEEKFDLLPWGIAGFLFGFAFGIKVLAIYGIVAAGTLWAYRQWGKFGAFGILSLGTCILFLGGLSDLAYMNIPPKSLMISEIILGLVGISSLLYALIKEKRKISIPSFSKPAIFLLFLMLPILPWTVKHISEHKSISFSNIITGKSPDQKFKIPFKILADKEDLNPLEIKRNQEKVIQQELDSLPNRKYQNGNTGKKKRAPKNNNKINTAEREEIKRYIGYEKGFPLYFSIPYDATMGNNIPGRPYIDISFLFLLLAPLIFLRRDKKGIAPNLFYSLIIVSALLGLGWISHYIPNGNYSTLENSIQNAINSSWGESGFASAWSGILTTIIHLFQGIDGPLYNLLSGLGFHFVLIFIIGMTALIHFLFKNKFRELPSSMKEISVLIFSTSILWFISANNIPWYGFPSLALMGILFAYLLQKPEWIAGTENIKFNQYFLGIILGIFFISMTALRLSNPEIGSKYSSAFIDKVFIQHATLGKTKQECLADLSPVYNIALDAMNENLDKKIYRAGTYLNYHIKENDRRVLEDNQLKEFESFSKKTHAPERFVDLLKYNGFSHILYDINTPNIDKTPEQSLAKRSNDFLVILSQHPGIKITATDRIVKSPNNTDFVEEKGKRQNAVRYGLLGPQVRQGTFILFEIL